MTPTYDISAKSARSMSRAILSVLALAGTAVLLGGCSTNTGQAHVAQVSRPPATGFAAPVDSAAAAPVPAVVAGATSPKPLAFTQVFPFVRVDREARVVEFDATVPLDAHDKETPIVFLELVACAPDTREHESIVLTKAKASQIHAAMILIGLKPGTPGRIDATGPKIEFVPATGDAVTIELHWRDAGGIERRARPEDWIMNLRDSRALGTEPGRPGGWLFAGSRFVNVTDPATGLKAEVYAADPGGTIIGLTTFGTETIAWRETFSPDSGLSTPEWITRNDAVPPINTPMRVQVRPAAAAR